MRLTAAATTEKNVARNQSNPRVGKIGGERYPHSAASRVSFLSGVSSSSSAASRTSSETHPRRRFQSRLLPRPELAAFCLVLLDAPALEGLLVIGAIDAGQQHGQMMCPLLILGRRIEEQTAGDDLAAGIQLAFGLGQSRLGCLQPGEMLIGFLLQFGELVGGDFSHASCSLLLWHHLAQMRS